MTKEQINHRLETKLLRVSELQTLYYETVKNKDKNQGREILLRIFDNKKSKK